MAPKSIETRTFTYWFLGGGWEGYFSSPKSQFEAKQQMGEYSVHTLLQEQPVGSKDIREISIHLPTTTTVEYTTFVLELNL